jgi:hypothetical protein
MEYRKQIPIGDLNKLNAAKLLLMAAGTSKYLKHYKNPKDLANHPIFNMIPLKPSGILQMAPLAIEKSLDEIVKVKEMEMKQLQ